MNRKPTAYYHGGGGESYWLMSSAGTTGVARSFWLLLVPWPWMLNGGYEKRAAEATLGGGVTTTTDAGVSFENVAVLDANGETADYSLVAGLDLPLGHYTLTMLAKDSAAVSNDLTMSVYDTTASASVASAAKTLTGSFAFYTLDFELTSTHDAHNIRFRVAKSTATANTILAHKFTIIPRKRNTSTPIHVFFPRDLARSALMTTTQRDTVTEA
jgi:hypothetical protein